MGYVFLSSQLAAILENGRQGRQGAPGQFGDGSTPRFSHYILVYLCAKIGAFIKKCTIGLNILGKPPHYIWECNVYWLKWKEQQKIYRDWERTANMLLHMAMLATLMQRYSRRISGEALFTYYIIQLISTTSYPTHHWLVVFVNLPWFWFRWNVMDSHITYGNYKLSKMVMFWPNLWSQYEWKRERIRTNTAMKTTNLLERSRAAFNS